MIAFIGLKVDKAKGRFFDRKRVTSRVDRATRKVLSRFGAFVRRTARSSIRKTKKKVAEPGQPPRGKTGLLKRLIFFVFQPADRSVVIGPAKLNQKSQPGPPVPELLEEGGAAPRRLAFFDKRSGELLRPVGKRSFKSLRDGRFVRGRRVEVRHSRDAPQRTIKYEPRPFMGPAYREELPKVPGMWRDAVKP